MSSTKFHAVSLPSRTGGDFFCLRQKRISNDEQGMLNGAVKIRQTKAQNSNQASIPTSDKKISYPVLKKLVLII
jgi:hypothetical protein